MNINQDWCLNWCGSNENEQPVARRPNRTSDGIIVIIGGLAVGLLSGVMTVASLDGKHGDLSPIPGVLLLPVSLASIGLGLRWIGCCGSNENEQPVTRRPRTCDGIMMIIAGLAVGQLSGVMTAASLDEKHGDLSPIPGVLLLPVSLFSIGLGLRWMRCY